MDDGYHMTTLSPSRIGEPLSSTSRVAVRRKCANAGNIRSDPGESLGEHPAPCQPDRTYELALPPQPKKKGGKDARRKARRDAKTDVWDEDTW